MCDIAGGGMSHNGALSCKAGPVPEDGADLGASGQSVGAPQSVARPEHGASWPWGRSHVT